MHNTEHVSFTYSTTTLNTVLNTDHKLIVSISYNHLYSFPSSQDCQYNFTHLALHLRTTHNTAYNAILFSCTDNIYHYPGSCFVHITVFVVVTFPCTLILVFWYIITMYHICVSHFLRAYTSHINFTSWLSYTHNLSPFKAPIHPYDSQPTPHNPQYKLLKENNVHTKTHIYSLGTTLPLPAHGDNLLKNCAMGLELSAPLSDKA